MTHFDNVMEVYFHFRLAFIDCPAVRLRTQQGRHKHLLQVILSAWGWNPPLPWELEGTVDPEEWNSHNSGPLVTVPTSDPVLHPTDLLYLPYASWPEGSVYHHPIQFTGACELDLERATLYQEYLVWSCRHFRSCYNRKQKAAQT